LRPDRSLDVLRTESEFRTERLGAALRGLAAELVDERRKVAELRREIAALKMQLGALTPAPRDDAVVPGGDGDGRA